MLIPVSLSLASFALLCHLTSPLDESISNSEPNSQVLLNSDYLQVENLEQQQAGQLERQKEMRQLRAAIKRREQKIEYLNNLIADIRGITERENQ